MGRRHSSDLPPRLPSPGDGAAGRFEYVARAKFAGSQSALARELDCSQSFLSRVIRREKEPGPKLLKALAQLPGVNAHWALTGEGKPLGSEQNPAVPVALALLPGPPKEYPAMLTGMTETVAPHHARDTVYMVVVTEPLAVNMVPGDRIVLEADSELWQQNLQMLDGKLCAIRRRIHGGEIIELRQLHCHVDPSVKTVQLRAYHSRSSEMEKHPVINKLYPPIQLDVQVTTRVKESNEAPKPFDVIPTKDVVAVALELYRRL